MALTIFSALLIPWRIANLQRGTSLAWLHADYFWGNAWKPDNSLHKMYALSGINTPCHVSPSVCHSLDEYDPKKNKLGYSFYKELALITFLLHPIDWYRYKGRFFSELWFGHKPRGWARVEGTTIALMGIAGFIILFWKKRAHSPRSVYFLVFAIGFLLFNIAVFTFLHFEWRYSIFLRVFFVMLPCWGLLALTPHRHNAPEGNRSLV